MQLSPSFSCCGVWPCCNRIVFYAQQLAQWDHRYVARGLIAFDVLDRAQTMRAVQVCREWLRVPLLLVKLRSTATVLLHCDSQPSRSCSCDRFNSAGRA